MTKPNLRPTILCTVALAGAACVSLLFTSPAIAVTPTQNTIAEAHAKAEAAARAKIVAELKTQTETAAKARALAVAKDKARFIAALSVHQETRRRLAAARGAADLHARIMDANAKGVPSDTGAARHARAHAMGRVVVKKPAAHLRHASQPQPAKP